MTAISIGRVQQGRYEDIEGTIRWYKDNKLHRDQQPAVEYENGITEWYQYGVLHRDNDLPAIDLCNGYGEWYIQGKKHRTNGPAVFYSLEHVEVKEWWLEGIEYTEEEFYHIIGKNITNDFLHIYLIDKEVNKQKIKI